MRILFILENYLPHIGGVETIFKNLSENLAKDGHDVSILTHRLKGTKKFEVMNGVKVYRTSCFYSRYVFSFFAVPKAISLGKNADVIHTTTYNGSLPAIISARINKKPSVITVHEILGKNWENFEMAKLSAKMHEFLEWVITRFSFSKFVAVSESTKKGLLEYNVPDGKIHVIYNGVDYEHFNPNKYGGKSVRKKLGTEKNFVYTFYGRPGISKGLEYLLKAVPEISSRIPNAKLMLILSKSPRRRYDLIMRMIKEMKISDRIILVEPLSHDVLPNYLLASDCVVVPSLTEGFGYAVAENNALGIPVAASNTTSIPEMISGKYVLFEPKNPKAIAKAVVDISKGKFSSGKLKKFTVSENIRNYLNLYKILLSKAKQNFEKK